jgi:hypothetical protein
MKGGSPVLKKLLEENKPESEAAHEGKAEPGKAEHAAKATGKPAAETAEPAKEDHAKSAENAGGKKEKAVKEGATKIQEKAREMEEEQHVTQKRADFYDGSELFLEISIVLCSIALLSENKRFWHVSFISTVAGICVALYGFLDLFAR